MSLPLLEGEYAKLIPQPPIAKDTVSPVQGFIVPGTGYPYYAWLPPRGGALLVNIPQHPPGAPVDEASPSKDPAAKQRDESFLTDVINGEVSYYVARGSVSEGFFDKYSTREWIRMHDGRAWYLFKGTYFARLNWKTKGPAPGAPRYTEKQMQHVLRDLVVGGGTVRAAMHKLQYNGFIVGDEDFFWTDDGDAYKWIDEKWVLQPQEGTPPKETKTSGMPEKDRKNLQRLEEKYPMRQNVRRMRTWAGPRYEDVDHDDEERLPANPTSSRLGNRGVKRKRDDANGNTGRPGNGNPPATGGRTKPPRKGQSKRKRPTKGKGKGKPAVPPKTRATKGQASK